MWRRLASGEPVATEGAQRRKDGSAFPVEIRVGLLGEVGGRRLALSIARDITGREASEERLARRAREKGRARYDVYGPAALCRSRGARAYMIG